MNKYNFEKMETFWGICPQVMVTYIVIILAFSPLVFGASTLISPPQDYYSREVTFPLTHRSTTPP